MSKDKCKSCGGAIVWAKTAKGKMTPLDAEPTPDGKWIVVDGDLVKALQGQKAYRSHWASCPGAGKHRKVKL